MGALDSVAENPSSVRPEYGGHSITAYKRVHEPGRHVLNPDESFSFKLHLSGPATWRLKFQDENMTVRARAGELLIGQPQVQAVLHVQVPTQIAYLNIAPARIRPWLLGLGAGADFTELHRRAVQDPSCARLFEVIWEAFHRSPADDSFGDLLLEGLVTRLATLRRASRDEDSRGGLSSRTLKMVQERLSENLSEPLSLADLARSAGVSTNHLARAFKVSTGVPPLRYRNLLRLELAKELLDGGGLSVTEVAARVGYAAPKDLVRLFRAHLGVTPSGYRKRRGA